MPDDVSKELEYTDALVKTAADKSDANSYELAHRTLSNLAVTAEKLENIKDRILTYLAISYFYVRMCESLPALQLSKTTNPSGFNIDCIKLSEKYFKLARSTAAIAGKREEADTYLYTGLGYDAMRGFLAKSASKNTSDIFRKATEDVQKSITLGTTFEGAKTVLARMNAQKPDSSKPVISPETFLQLHRSFFMSKSLTPPSTLDYLKPETSDPVISDPDNTYIDYRWRFYIRKPDTSWTFATGTTKTSFRLTIYQKSTSASSRPPVSLVAQELSPADSSSSLAGIVAKSAQLLAKAGYTIESQSETEFKGNPAIELILNSAYKDIGVKSKDDKTAATPLTTKLYMFVVMANGIQYVLSFNAIDDNYARVFPDMKIIANTFTPF